MLYSPINNFFTEKYKSDVFTHIAYDNATEKMPQSNVQDCQFCDKHLSTPWSCRRHETYCRQTKRKICESNNDKPDNNEQPSMALQPSIGQDICRKPKEMKQRKGRLGSLGQDFCCKPKWTKKPKENIIFRQPTGVRKKTKREKRMKLKKVLNEIYHLMKTIF